jgi:carboxymethylenebutenolidase
MPKNKPNQPLDRPNHEVDGLYADGQALQGARPSNRRDFLIHTSAASVLAGFALAVRPVSAQQLVSTDQVGLETGTADIQENGVSLSAYYAKPQNVSGELPVVIVCSEIFGVHEHIADVARRLAKQGYFAIAPAFFTRAGDPASRSSVAEILKDIISQTPDAQVMQDIGATLAWCLKQGADPDRIGITGFCWGGRITWLACSQFSQFKAGVAWYGRLVGERTENFPAHPVDLAKDLKAPVLGLYGGQDDGIPLSTVEQMQAALAAAQGNAAAQASMFEIYPEAPHAFHADYRATYRQQAAQNAWQQCLAWFKQYGV